MKRVILGGLAAALAMFVWGNVSWMLLPWHDSTMSSLPKEAETVAALQGLLPESGIYVFPGMDEAQPGTEGWDKFIERHEQGPVGMLFYHAEGFAPMPPSTMIMGFVINLLMCWISASILWLLRDNGLSYGKRVAVVGGIGVVAALAGHVNMWNWFHYPTHYSMVMAADNVVALVIAGLVLAGIVKGASAAPSPSNDDENA